MVRPRWHDALIVVAILGVLVVGVWALWWDDVRAVLGLPSEAAGKGSGAAPAPAPSTAGQT